MSGSATGAPGWGNEAPKRTAGTRDAASAILIVLALGLALRLILTQALPGSGFEVDLQAFRFWASNLAEQGPFGFYERDFFHDYTPGYLYVLWGIGLLDGFLPGPMGDLIKLPAILADVALGWLVWSMARELGAGRSSSPTRSAGSIRSSGARSTRSASSSFCSRFASCGGIARNGRRSSRWSRR